MYATPTHNARSHNFHSTVPHTISPNFIYKAHKAEPLHVQNEIKEELFHFHFEIQIKPTIQLTKTLQQTSLI